MIHALLVHNTCTTPRSFLWVFDRHNLVGWVNNVMVRWGGGFCVGLNLRLSVGKTDGFVGGVSGD